MAVLPLPAADLIITGGRLRTRPLRRPPEQHPLQNCQVSPQPPQLGRLLRILHPQPRVLLAQLTHQPRHLPVGFQGSSQHIPELSLSP
jgi:hypothetical protein